MNEVLQLKLPPHSVDAERAVLGSVLIDPECFNRIDLTPEDFYRSEHQIVYRAMQKCALSNKTPDVVVIGGLLEQSGELDAVGGMGFLASLADATVTAVNVREYAGIIKERSALRAGITLAHEIANAGFQGDLQAMNHLMGNCLLANSGNTKNQWDIQTSLRVTLEYIDRVHQGKERPGLPFGIAPMDEKYPMGMRPGNFIVIGARPSMGKTAVMLNMMLRQKNPVACFSLEMEHDELSMRMIAMLAGIDYQKIATAKMTDEEWGRFSTGVARLNERKIFIHDQGGMTIHEIVREATNLKRKHDISAIWIDYMQLINAEGENRTNQIGEVSRQLKALAKRLRIPVIALAQLNRSLEQRQNKRPMMSDLRESGQIEQDADAIIFLYRDAVYEDVPDTIMEFLVEKMRNGPVSLLTHGWNPDLMLLQRNVRNAND